MKRKLLIIMVLIIAQIFTAFLTGCSNKEVTPKIVYTTKSGTLDTFTNNINNYYIETSSNKSLTINTISNDDYKSLIQNINTMSAMSSKQFMISHLKSWCSNLAFRKVENKKEIYYYCIFKSNGGEKSYLFFDNLEELGGYRCFEYVCVKQDGRYTNSSEENLYFCIEKVDL